MDVESEGKTFRSKEQKHSKEAWRTGLRLRSFQERAIGDSQRVRNKIRLFNLEIAWVSIYYQVDTTLNPLGILFEEIAFIRLACAHICGRLP